MFLCRIPLERALSIVDTESLLQAPVSSVTNVLAGSVPGVSTVQTSGQPGKDAASIYIRGTGSLSSSLSAPLVLVDGVERDFSQIDPNEVENMSILKDAASTAVFGVRGANGVVLITTKRGKEGRMSINVSPNTGVQQPIALVEQVGSYEFANFWNIKMSPLRHLHPLPAAESLQTELKHPLRLLLLRRNQADYIFIETFGYELLFYVCDEAMFILLVCNDV